MGGESTDLGDDLHSSQGFGREGGALGPSAGSSSASSSIFIIVWSLFDEHGPS